jgi:hypothetical protein
MTSFARLTVAAAAALAAACAATSAGAGSARCGQTNYSYAGVSSIQARFGVGARISVLHRPAVAKGHVAGWVGVGGSGLGPGGTDEWLQVGISAKPGEDPALYYEVTQPDLAPRYVMLKGHLPIGKSYDVAVLESRRHPGSWRVWVNGTSMTSRIRLPGSHGAWRPIATAESWNGDSAGTCNGFAFKFAHVQVATTPGGNWRPIDGRVLADAGYRVERTAPDSLLALGG